MWWTLTVFQTREAEFSLPPLQPEGTWWPSSGQWDIHRGFCFLEKRTKAISGSFRLFLILGALCWIKPNAIFILSVLLCPIESGSLEPVFTDLLRHQGFSVELFPHVGSGRQNYFTSLHSSQLVLRRALYSAGWSCLLKACTFGSKW